MKLQSWFIEAGKNSCLAQAYIAAGIMNKANLDDYTLAVTISATLMSAYNDGLLGPDFYVKDAVALIEYACGEKATVEKKVIESCKDLPLGYAAVEFKKDDKSHFVLCKDGFVVYDGLEKSVCRMEGKPVSARIIKFIGENK